MLLDYFGVDSAVLGGIFFGVNVSLFVVLQHFVRVRGLVLEMLVLEWVVLAVVMMFVLILLVVYYALLVVWFTSNLVCCVPPILFGFLNSVLHVGSLTPEVLASIMHGVFVGLVVFI